MSRNKDPAVLFYTSDFLSGVMGLTMTERGQYITLLCLQHQKGHLTEKDIELAVGSVSADVMAKFISDDEGKYFNKRMEEEAERRRRFTESRRKSSLSRFKDTSYDTSYDTSHVEHTIHRMDNDNRNINITEDSNIALVPTYSYITTTTTTNNEFVSIEGDEFALQRRISEIFRDLDFKGDPQDFIAYNRSRAWRGIGGENVLDDLDRYATRWAKQEALRTERSESTS